MNELFFPIFGAALMVLAVLPVCAALCKVALALLDRVGGAGLVRFGAPRYLLLILSSLMPIAWTLSAGLHQAESGRSVLACLVTHDLQELCLEPLLFVALFGCFVVLRAWPWIASYRRAACAGGSRVSAEALRIASLADRRPELLALAGRFSVTERPIRGTATVGLWRPVIVVEASFVRSCDDETLAAALAHEVEHLRARDPLRYFLLSLAVELNPFGRRLLGREAAAWVFQREVQCDRAAVLAGAAPLDVARALLCASRPSHPALAHLRGGVAGKLRLRVELLLAYAEKRPRNDSRHGTSALALSLVAAAIAIALPHGGTTDPLDVLHTSVERVAAAILN